MVSIPACHAGDQGSIPWHGGLTFLLSLVLLIRYKIYEKVRLRVKESNPCITQAGYFYTNTEHLILYLFYTNWHMEANKVSL